MLILDQLPNSDFIGALSSKEKKITTKIPTTISLWKMKGENFISEREVVVQPNTTFTVKKENGKTGFLTPSSNFKDVVIVLEGTIAGKKDDEIIHFKEFKMTEEDFLKHFRIEK